MEVTDDGFDDFGRKITSKSASKSAKESAALARLHASYGGYMSLPALLGLSSPFIIFIYYSHPFRPNIIAEFHLGSGVELKWKQAHQILLARPIPDHPTSRRPSMTTSGEKKLLRVRRVRRSARDSGRFNNKRLADSRRIKVDQRRAFSQSLKISEPQVLPDLCDLSPVIIM